MSLFNEVYKKNKIADNQPHIEILKYLSVVLLVICNYHWARINQVIFAGVVIRLLISVFLRDGATLLLATSTCTGGILSIDDIRIVQIVESLSLYTNPINCNTIIHKASCAHDRQLFLTVKIYNLSPTWWIFVTYPSFYDCKVCIICKICVLLFLFCKVTLLKLQADPDVLAVF